VTGHFLSDLRASFAAHADRPAVRHGDRLITYGELDGLTRRAAGWLQRLGVGPGDRVALYTADKLAFLVAQLGATFAGGVPLPLNPQFTREEMRYFLTDSGARVVVAGEGQQSLVTGLAAELPDRPQVVPDAAAATAPDAAWREPTVLAGDPCLMLYSSGTTGWPKGVVHTHANTASALQALGRCWRMTPDDVVVNLLPLFHIHGLAFATHLTWLTGGCVHVEEGFDPARALSAIGRGTVFMAVPTIYYRLLDDPGFREAARAWPRVRLFTCGSAPIRAEVLPALEEILGRPVINRYGMTEAFVITSLPLDGPWPSGSVGLPLAGVEASVVDAEGRPVSAGEVGRVRVRGPNLFREYWRNPEATKKAFASGWFDTGDLGSLDGRGFLTLAGRSGDLIITAGYNVYPQVVERVLNACPGVRESAVFGVPDPLRGEAVSAAVVRADPALDEARLRAFVAERLVDYQRPRSIFFVEELPRNAMGKVLAADLRRLAP
jgi:malonyl-CoA/methylmalonyl-CoA synthetase